MEVPGLADPLTYRPAEALEVFPIGRTALYELLRSGEIESFRVGRARFIPRRSLVAYMERQLSEEQEAAARAR
jgi:excisionase family DNA binding protein